MTTQAQQPAKTVPEVLLHPCQVTVELTDKGRFAVSRTGDGHTENVLVFDTATEALTCAQEWFDRW